MIFHIFSHKKILTALKILVSGVLVYWLIFSVEWLSVWEHLTNISIAFILLYIIVYVVGIVISSYKWQQLACFYHFHYAYEKFFSWYVTGTFLNNFFPSFIGGDAYRIYVLGKKDKRFDESSSTVIMDRISGLLAIIVLTLIFAVINFSLFSSHVILAILAGFFFCLLLFFIGGVYLSRTSFVARYGKKLPRFIRRYGTKLVHYRDASDVVFRAFITSILFSFVGLAFANYILFHAIGVSFSLYDYLSVIFLISAVSSVPISIGNIGVKEWAYILFFGFLGVSSSVAVTVVLLSRILQMLVSFVGLPLYLREKRFLGKKSL